MADFPVIADQDLIVIAAINSWNNLGMNPVANGGAAWSSANRAIYIPFPVSQPFLAQKMSVANATVVSGNVDLGIYDDQQNLIVSKGSTAQAGTSVTQTLDITDTTLLPGRYYMACVLDNATGTVAMWQGAAGGAVASGGASGVLQQASAFPLPSTATMVALTTGLVPLIAVYGRSLV